MSPRFERGRGGPGGHGGPMGPGGPGQGEHAKYLAEALGITEDKLHAAQQAAKKKAMEQAVAGGQMMQEQAADMQARQADMEAEKAFMKYIEDNKLLEVAADAAVKDGVITQAQADKILARPLAIMARGGPGGRQGQGRQMAGGRRQDPRA